MNKVYERLASLLNALSNCVQHDNKEWATKHQGSIDDIMKRSPSGSGIDCGTKLDTGRSTSERLVFDASYHHMNENGMYDGWTEHQIIVTPSLQFGFNLRISGRDRTGIKDYLYEIYYTWLMESEEEELCKADIEERKEILDRLSNLEQEQFSLAEPYERADQIKMDENEKDIHETLVANGEALTATIGVLKNLWNL